MKKSKHGEIDTAQVIKAGCGIRYDPEQLGEDTEFDFSGAQKMKPDEGTTSSDEDIPSDEANL